MHEQGALPVAAPPPPVELSPVQVAPLAAEVSEPMPEPVEEPVTAPKRGRRPRKAATSVSKAPQSEAPVRATRQLRKRTVVI